MKKSLKMDLTSVDSCLNIPEKDECCICLDDFKNEEDALMNKFAKTKCPCCRTLNIRDFNSLSKEHILYLLNASLDNTHILAKAITTISKTAENKKTIEWRKVRETLEPTKIIFGL